LHIALSPDFDQQLTSFFQIRYADELLSIFLLGSGDTKSVVNREASEVET
jgi:hypothetical protein